MPEFNAVRNCPKCGEEVEKEWRICPACEHPLKEFMCPGCGKVVKEHWKRCPFCEARLLCSICQGRLAPGDTGCLSCNEASAEPTMKLIKEPVAGMEFAPVAGGVFLMGDQFEDGTDNEKPVHQVGLDSFYIGLFPVTQSQWSRLMTENPSKFAGEKLPVERVSFHQAFEFAEKLTEANRRFYRFTLPTEAQWEYAARSGGKKEKYAGGDAPSKLAWFEENSDGMSHPVGKKAPNGLGLYDMSGNVWEWCLDFFQEDAYESHSENNPLCYKKCADRTIRGGGWNTDAWSVRCSRRFGFRAEDAGPSLGFRLIISRIGEKPK